MIEDSYACFRHPAICPLTQVDDNLFLLELFHGPTLAFKDVAMQLLGRLMDHVLRQRGSRATIVGATSGDTGSAAVEAFKGLDQVDVFVLFPHGRVSEVQRRQMTTVACPNVHAIAIDGTFDDCQDIVKSMFQHGDFAQDVHLSGVNSINWARVAAQAVYYFTSAVSLGSPHRPVSFAVPTGNFGDILAGWVAKRMGLPIERLMIGTNANDILARTLEHGAYEVRGVQPTTSPSMDIQISSNFERLLFEALGRDATSLGRLMAGLKQSGAFISTPPYSTPCAPSSTPPPSPSPRSRRRSPAPTPRPGTSSIPTARSACMRPASCSPRTRTRPWWRSPPRTRPSSRTRWRRRSAGGVRNCRRTSPT